MDSTPGRPPGEAPAGQSPEREPRPAAVYIGPLIVQSGATLRVGLLMLVAGMVIGFLLRPVVPAITPSLIAQAGQNRPGTAAATDAAAGTSAAPRLPTPTIDPARAAQAERLMQAVVGQTRHFVGEPNAAVVIVEFGDFQ